jgi:hypothetical protein
MHLQGVDMHAPLLEAGMGGLRPILPLASNDIAGSEMFRLRRAY